MGDAPNLEEAREAARRIIRDGKRAGDVISRIRGLVWKTVPEKTRLDIDQAVREVISLTQSEAVGKGATVRTKLADYLSFMLGDPVGCDSAGGLESGSLVGTRQIDELVDLPLRTNPGGRDRASLTLRSV
jgi:hypothetical protein